MLMLFLATCIPMLPFLAILLCGLPPITLLPRLGAFAAASPQPPRSPPSCTVPIPNPSTAPSLPVPPSFLGPSHEPLTIAAPVLRDSTYRRLLLLLSSFRTGPFILRWGGIKQHELNTTLGEEHRAAMRDVHRALGVRYMLGLSLAVRSHGIP